MIGVEILLYEERDGKIFVVKPVKLVLEQAEDGLAYNPTLFLPDVGFLQEVAEELDKIGVKTEKDAKIQGTLEATRFHLGDLRKLLKLQ